MSQAIQTICKQVLIICFMSLDPNTYSAQSRLPDVEATERFTETVLMELLASLPSREGAGSYNRSGSRRTPIQRILIAAATASDLYALSLPASHSWTSERVLQLAKTLSASFWNTKPLTVGPSAARHQRSYHLELITINNPWTMDHA